MSVDCGSGVGISMHFKWERTLPCWSSCMQYVHNCLCHAWPYLQNCLSHAWPRPANGGNRHRLAEPAPITGTSSRFCESFTLYGIMISHQQAIKAPSCFRFCLRSRSELAISWTVPGSSAIAATRVMLLHDLSHVVPSRGRAWTRVIDLRLPQNKCHKCCNNCHIW